VKTIFSLLFCSILLFFFIISPLWAENLTSEKPSKDEYTVLKVCEGVIQLFKQSPDSVWPGFNLAQKPLVVYIPEKWALLFNYSKEADGFIAYPKDWPNLGTKVLFHQGQYKDLAGQLVFDLSIDTEQVAAVSFSGEPEVDFFAFIVHENFHQYQQYGKHRAFGEIAWEREEKYPIQDSQNTALAYLEMRLLMDALEKMKIGDEKKCQEYVKQFVAVRDYRWKQSDPFVARYEQGQEINEGVAKYVEVKSIAFMATLKYNSSFAGLITSLSEDFSKISFLDYLFNDFRQRITNGSISPEDMPRNRIYPVGAAQGLLLDYFKIDWKKKAQEAGPEFTCTQLFKESLGLNESQLENLLNQAKKNYKYNKVLSSSGKLIQEYLAGYKKGLEAFEAQPGYRIEIEISAKSFNRSAASSSKKWVVDKGTKSLNSHYNIYVLKNNDLLLQVQDAGLFEENDWSARKKKVVFFIPEISSIILDGKSFGLEDGLFPFKNIEINGKNLKFSCTKPGTILMAKNSIKINLIL
jgi:hypothetical protein